MSEANLVTVRSISEAASYGTTPGTGNWDIERMNGITLAPNVETGASALIRADRQVADQPRLNYSVAGEMPFDYNMGSIDHWLEAVFCETWAANVLGIGTSKISRSVEVENDQDGSANFQLFKGVMANSLSLNVAFGSIITGSLGFVGKNVTLSGSTAVVTGTNAEVTSPVTTGYASVDQIQIGGGAPGSTVRAITLNVANNLRPIQGLGSTSPDGPDKYNLGRVLVTGNIEMYFDDNALYNDLINGTTSDLQFRVTDGSNHDVWEVPNIKLSSGGAPVSGTDTDIMASFEFMGLYDAADTALKLTRTRA